MFSVYVFCRTLAFVILTHPLHPRLLQPAMIPAGRAGPWRMRRGDGDNLNGSLAVGVELRATGFMSGVRGLVIRVPVLSPSVVGHFYHEFLV